MGAGEGDLEWEKGLGSMAAVAIESEPLPGLDPASEIISTGMSRHICAVKAYP